MIYYNCNCCDATFVQSAFDYTQFIPPDNPKHQKCWCGSNLFQS